MQTVIIVIHLMIVSVLIGAVLLQKSEGGGLGMGGGAGFMSSRGTANLLTRTTAILAGDFLRDQHGAGLARRRRPQAGLDPRHAPATQSQPGGATPIAPPTSGGVLDTLKKVDEQQAPVRPAGPAFAIKQGGYAGRRLPSCLRTSHQCFEIAFKFNVTHSPAECLPVHAIRFGESGQWP